MCGVAGLLQPGVSADAWSESLHSLGAALKHRGPDDAGIWFDATSGVGLSHRRLAIIDRTPAGRQPMLSACGRWVLAYNGEIYNFQALRAELEGYPFGGRSDTEVLLAALATWGVAATLRRLRGMFAFAAVDRDQGVLHLVRDPLGIKPLYWGWQPGRFVFASELAGILALPGFRRTVDREALAAYLRFGYVPAPRCILLGVRQLPPGCRLSVRPGQQKEPVAQPYWEAEATVQAARQAPFSGSMEEATEEVERRLKEAVAERLVADVPLGCFLSGGIDSSTVVALARSAGPIRTFSMGVEESGFDERQHARRIASHLGTDHTELTVTPQMALQLVEELPALYAEPFGDSSAIPTVLLSRLTRQHVAVALSGDGGDELFGGYRRYWQGERLWRLLQSCPAPLRRWLKGGLERLPLGALGEAVGRARRSGPVAERLQRLLPALGAATEEALYAGLVQRAPDPEGLVRGGLPVPTPVPLPSSGATLAERMMAADLVGYLPGDILTKVDRASMSVGLEVRVPLLDVRLVRFAAALPVPWKVDRGRGKVLLRQVLARHVPPALWERPKAGFSVPLGRWLRGPLKEWAEELLAPNRLEQADHLRPEAVQALWQEHQSGRRNWQEPLWSLLMFQAWWAHWGRCRTVSAG